MGYGVIGSPTDSGSVSLGSSPSTPATEVPIRWKGLRIGRLPGPDRCTHLVGPAVAPLCSGLARRPLKAVARVRIPSGLLPAEAQVIRPGPLSSQLSRPVARSGWLRSTAGCRDAPVDEVSGGWRRSRQR